MVIGSSVESDGAISWSTPITLLANKSTYLVPAGVPDGTYWYLKFTSIQPLDNVVEDAVLVVEDDEQVVALDPAQAWRFNLQGFMLFGAVEGAK